MSGKAVKIAVASFAVIGVIAATVTVMLFAMAACPEFIEYG